MASGQEVLCGCWELPGRDDLAALTQELWAPERLSAAGIGPDQARFEDALAGVQPAVVQSGR